MREEILKLKSGEMYIVPESDYGKAEIWKINSQYFLFEIPLFGGEPLFHSYFNEGQEDKIISVVNSWT